MAKKKSKKNKKNKSKDLSQDILANIQSIHFLYEKQLDSIFTTLDISNEQYNVLGIVNNAPNGNYSLKEIQALLPNKTTNTTRLVNKLHLKKLLAKTVDKSDKRRLNITLTQTGADLLAKGNKSMTAMNQKLNNTLKGTPSKLLLEKLIDLKKGLK